MFKKIFIVLLLAGALIVMSGCEEPVDQFEPADPEEAVDPPAMELSDQLPLEVEQWIEQSIERFKAGTFEHEGILYLLVSYGEKPTAGYEVEITDITEEDDKLVVTANFTEPGEDDVVAQVITYPFDLAMLDDPGLPVEFVATGAETEIPIED